MNKNSNVYLTTILLTIAGFAFLILAVIGGSLVAALIGIAFFGVVIYNEVFKFRCPHCGAHFYRSAMFYKFCPYCKGAINGTEESEENETPERNTTDDIKIQ